MHPEHDPELSLDVGEELLDHARAVARRVGDRVRRLLPPPARLRVLVVDDNQDAADMLANLLRLLQADVRVVYDGQSALDLMDVFRPEAIVLDLGMPGMDGYEVARRVRAQPAGARLALIALSGWGQERDRERTAEVGFDVHLVKPVDLDRILTVLRELDGKSSRAE